MLQDQTIQATKRFYGNDRNSPEKKLQTCRFG